MIRDPSTARSRDRPVRIGPTFFGPGPIRDLEIFPVLVQSGPKLQNFAGPRTRTEPLGPRPTGFGPLIPAYMYLESADLHKVWTAKVVVTGDGNDDIQYWEGYRIIPRVSPAVYHRELIQPRS